jgi:hypothetical protein
MGQGFANYWLLNNYSRINLELTKLDQSLIINEGNNLFIFLFYSLCLNSNFRVGLIKF